jgi:2-polyprenyl-3-methyl-5-hydroxy-6-metoxy-1,4-benzoquinol methylase
MENVFSMEAQAEDAAIAQPYFDIVNPEIATIVRRLGRGLKVLDVGCGSGNHGAMLKAELGHEVYGVDNSAISVEKARKRIDGAQTGDVRRPDLYSLPSGTHGYDLLVFSDILEHLDDPLSVLRSHLKLLTPSGHVVLSIPNIAIWAARLRLLLGLWEYEDTGTFDRTDIRFFTRRSMRRLIRESGLEILSERISPGIVRPFVPLVKAAYVMMGAQSGCSSIMDSGLYRAYQRWVYPLESLSCRAWPTLMPFNSCFSVAGTR